MNKLMDLFFTFARIGGLTFGGGSPCSRCSRRRSWKNAAGRRRRTDGLLCHRTMYPRHHCRQYSHLCGPENSRCERRHHCHPGRRFPVPDIIITIIAAFIQNFAHLAIVQNAFAGIRVCVCVLIFNAVVKLWKKSVIDKPTFAVFILVLLGSALTSLSPVVFIILAALFGIIVKNKEAAKK